MTNHYTRIGQENLLSSLMDESKVIGSKRQNPKILSNYQLMCMINKYLKQLNLTPYTEEELEMELN